MLPTLQVSKGYKTVARLVPDPANQRYDIEIVRDAADREMKAAKRARSAAASWCTPSTVWSTAPR